MRGFKVRQDWYTEHWDQSYFWEMISWKLKKMADVLQKHLITDKDLSPEEKEVGMKSGNTICAEVLEAKKWADYIANEEFSADPDNVEAENILEQEQAAYEKAVDAFADVLKKYARGWWS
jgi:hypothetical protein